MFQIDLGEMLNQAEKDGPVGASSSAQLPEGTHNLEIVRTKEGTTKDGKTPSFGLNWKVLDGELAGQSTWQNIYLRSDDAMSVRIFIDTLVSLGISKELLATSPPMEQILAMLEGVKAVVNVTHKAAKTGDKTYVNFRVQRLIGDDEETSSNAVADDSLFG